MVKRIVLVAALFCGVSELALGQRLVRTLRPPEAPEGEELRFDTNLAPLTNLSLSPGAGQPDANYAPHLVFTPDSTRVFAVFPGSDRMLGWDVATGELAVDLEIPGNPASVTTAPDGKQVAVVSLFIAENFGDAANNFEGERIGAITMIDLETLETRSLALTEVFFSFFNNVVFTTDGTRAYIASAATDELLQIDIATMREAGPRIKFEAGTRPTPISISPDSSTLALTLIGSAVLPRDEVPDSVQLVDTGTFAVTRSIVPDPFEIPIGDGTTVEVRHDFVATNNLAFSADGKWGLIAEQSSSSLSGLPEFTTDRGLLIDMETAQVDEVFATGGVSGMAVLVPGSTLFAVVSAADLSFVNYDPDTRESWRTQDPRSQFRTSSRPAFRGDQILLGSPVRDAVVRFDLPSGDLRNIVAVGPEFEPENLSIPAGALDVSVSPDDQTIAAVVFNDNSVDLFKPTKRFVLPQFVQDASWSTGIALTNVSGKEIEVIGLAYNNVGFPFFDVDECADSEDEDCENIVEFLNPQTFVMQPEEQVSFTPLGFLEAAFGETVDGWLDLDVDAESMSGMFLSLDGEVTRMDGGGLGEAGGLSHIVTHFRATDSYTAELVLINSSLALSSVQVQLVNSDGNLVTEVSVPIAPAGRIARLLVDPDVDAGLGRGLFAREDFEEGKEHYLVLNAGERQNPFVRYYNDRTLGLLEGTQTIGPGAQLAQRQIAPQVVAFDGNSSTLTAINFSAEEAVVTLTLHPDDGQLEVDPVEVTLQSATVLKEDVADLFGLEDAGQIVSGWVDVVSDTDGLFGSLEFQLFDGKAMSVLPFFPEGSKRIIFSHVAQGLGFSTRMVALNPTDQTATVTVILRLVDGSQVASTQLVLEPGERVSLLLNQLFGQEIEQIGGRIDLLSDVAIIAVELFFSEDREILSAVPGQTPGE